MRKQHLDNLRRKLDKLGRKDALRGAETTKISVRLEGYSASHFEGSAMNPLKQYLGQSLEQCFTVQYRVLFTDLCANREMRLKEYAIRSMAYAEMQYAGWKNLTYLEGENIFWKEESIQERIDKALNEAKVLVIYRTNLRRLRNSIWQAIGICEKSKGVSAIGPEEKFLAVAERMEADIGRVIGRVYGLVKHAHDRASRWLQEVRVNIKDMDLIGNVLLLDHAGFSRS